ncbi:MAG: hypothetical protein ACOY5B_15665 [Spirochaetota bacterium]
MDRLNLIATPWQQRLQEASHNFAGVGRALTAAMVVSLGPGIEAAEEVVRFRGDAYDLATGKFVYSENHSEYRKGGVHVYSRVSYRDRSGKEFANKLITFQANKLQPTYELRDARDGYVEGIRREGGQTVYYARRKADQPLQSKAIATPAPAVFDAGFDYFVRENFDRICSGKNAAFNFAVPIELDYFRFRVSMQEAGEVCRMNLELDNFVLRQLVKPIKLWYDTKERRLRKYEGISNINGPDGKSLKVRVVFNYAVN